MLVRLAAPEEALFLAEAWYAMLAECGQLAPVTHPDWRALVAEDIALGIRQGTAVWFAGEEDGVIVSTAAVFRRATPAQVALFGHRATIGGVYTKPAFRRRGFAEALVERAVAFCREEGCISVRLVASLPGRPLYEKLGFVDGDEMVKML